MLKDIFNLLQWLAVAVYCMPNQFTTEYSVGTGSVSLPYQSVVHLTVEQKSANSFGFNFIVDNPSRLLPAFIDGVACSDSCYFTKKNGENVSLAYEPENYNFAVFQQSNQQTLFFFVGCRQDVSVCKIAQLRTASFCACEDADSCDDAEVMDSCQSTTIATTSATLPSTTTETTSTIASTNIVSTATTPTTVISTSIFTTTEITTYTSTTTTETTPATTLEPSTSSSAATTTEISTTITSSLQTTPLGSSPAITSAETDTTAQHFSTSTAEETTTVLPTIQIVGTPTEVLKNISDSGVTLQNVTESLNITVGITNKTSSLSSDDIYYVANIVTDSANLTGIQEIDAQLILTNIDNVLNADVEMIIASGSQQKFIDSLPLMVINCNSTTVKYIHGDNLGFASNQLDNNQEIYGLVDHRTSFEVLSSDSTNSKLNTISVPKNLLQESSIDKIFFTIYRNKKLFVPQQKYRTYGSRAEESSGDGEQLPDLCDRQTQLPEDSPVMTAAFVNSEGAPISELFSQTTMANLQFNVTSILRPLHGSYEVTWWDPETQEWSTSELCNTQLHGDVVVSQCPHLTDFTLIVDSKVDDPAVCDPVLTDVSLTTNVISIFSLFLLIIMQITAYIPFLAASMVVQKIVGGGRNSDAIQLMFNVTLFLFYMIFTLFSNEKVSGKACGLTAAFCYSLLLCSILLTIFQAQKTVIMLFPKFIRKFNQIVMHPLSAFTIAFLIPFILSVLLSFFTNFFKRNDGYCWVRPDFVIYATIIPVSILLLNGLLCTVLVVWRMLHARRKYSRNGKHHDGQRKAKIISILLLQITMGMPWIVQYFTLYTPNTTAWHYVFSIIIGSQGTMLALIYLYRRRRMSRMSTEKKRRTGDNPTPPELEDEEMPNYQDYYLANPTL